MSQPEIILDASHVPAYLAGQVRATVSTWRDRGLIDGYDDLLLDVHCRSLMDVCGACERIRKTPLARSYLHFIRQSIGLYLLTLPWGLVNTWYYWAIPATSIIAYFMIGIELIAEEVEEPFGRSEDDLRLDDICDGIEKSVDEILSIPLR